MFEEDQLGEELGRGGYGVVFALKENPELVVKISNKKSNCRVWSDEFNKIKNTMSRVEDNTFYKNLKYVEILQPIEFMENKDQLCFMLMPRIYRPDKKDGPTLQSIFGEKNMNVVHKGRGQFIGLEQIKEFIPEETIKKVVYELGIAMGLIHFIGKNDGYDIEVFLGMEYKTKKVKCYIADFDLTESISKYDEETINRMLWSLEAVQYFPLSDNIELFDSFIKGYSKVGIDADIKPEVLKKIITEYSDY